MDELVPTQQEQEPSSTGRTNKRQKKGKGKGKAKAGTPPSGNPFSILDTLGPSAHLEDIPDIPELSTLKGWDNFKDKDRDGDTVDPFASQHREMDLLYRGPKLQCIEANMLLSVDALWDSYQCKAPDDRPMEQWLEEVEIGWGGSSASTGPKMNEALGLHARYAVQHLWPTMGPEVEATICRGSHPSKHLQPTDNFNLHLMMEEYNLQISGTGLGALFFNAIPHHVLNTHLDLQACIMTMQTPPNSCHPLSRVVAAANEHTKRLVSMGTWAGPPLSHESAAHLLHNYCVEADLPLDHITKEIVYDVATTHTPKINIFAGIHSVRCLQKHIHNACFDAALSMPTPSHDG
ncbi:hypothetical protein EI94DRAFT_1816075 [Lactarius quietus]|nr:hypothetical protein EI94DRAFT_1816075 [Lactarius quietus]